MLRRKFIQNTTTVVAGAMLSDSLFASALNLPKKKIAMVGTGLLIIPVLFVVFQALQEKFSGKPLVKKVQVQPINLNDHVTTI